MPNVTELIFFTLRPDVRTEEPPNEDGQALLALFHDTKNQSSYSNSAWGREVENEDIIVWAIGTPSLPLPILCQVDDACTLTVIEQTGQTPAAQVAHHCQLDVALIEWRRALMDDLTDEKLRPKRWAMGHVERPGTRHHPYSPSKEAFAVIMAIGWESIDAHWKAKETDVYKNAIRPIRYKLLQTGPEFLKGEVLNMSHIQFQPC